MPELPTHTASAVNLRRLLLLRWIALAGQCVAVVVAFAGLHIALPLVPVAWVIGVAVAVNAATGWRLRRRWPIAEPELFVQLVFDVLALTALLYWCGGSTNPFVSLYLLPLTLTAVALPWAYVWSMAALTVGCYSLLLFFYVPLPTAHAGHGEDFQLHVFGMWLGFLLSAALISYFVVRMTQTLRERDRLRAHLREQALRHERTLALGTLAAGAAHELATPLATIAVLTTELARGRGDAASQLTLLREQVARCKDILGSLSAASGAPRAEGGSAVALDCWLDELLVRARALRPEARIRSDLDGPRPAPRVVADATLSQALMNVLNNALDASAADVEVQARWSVDALAIDVRDRGPGLSAAAAEHAGEPFFTTKAPGVGMGLGLFLARGTVERLGGSLALTNRAAGGALCRVIVPLANLRVGDP
jgi:two-component system sensor histidine kinase RegB